VGSSAYARQAAERAAQIDRALAARKSEYRQGNVFAGVALVVALLSIPGTVVSAFWDLPAPINYFVMGAPGTVALLGLVVSWKLGLSTRLAWLALAISVATGVAGVAIAAQRVFTF